MSCTVDTLKDELNGVVLNAGNRADTKKVPKYGIY